MSGAMGVADGRPLTDPAFSKRGMACWVQFISTPTVDTPGTALLMTVNDKRYVWGQMHEGLQRCLSESKIKPKKCTRIFMTGPLRWPASGGLLGFLLTVINSRLLGDDVEAADEKHGAAASPSPRKRMPAAEDEPITVHAGRNLAHYLASARRFVLKKDVCVRTHEFDEHTSDEPALVETTSATADPGQGLQTSPNIESKNAIPPSWKDNRIEVWAMNVGPSVPEASSVNRISTQLRKRDHATFEETGDQMLPPLTPSDPDGKLSDENAARQDIISNMFYARQSTMIKTQLSQISPESKYYVRDKETGHLTLGGEPQQAILYGSSASTPLPPDTTVYMPYSPRQVHFLPPTAASPYSLSYIVKTRPRRGVFLAAAAKALGIKPGPQFGQLAAGESITLEDGRTITPDMVLGPTRLGHGFAIIDLPTLSYVKNLLRRREWQSREIMAGVEFVIWMLGPGVAEDKDLTDFMAKMSHLRHFVSSPERCPNYLAFASAAAANVKLNRLNPRWFPVPVYRNEPALQDTNTVSAGLTAGSHDRFKPVQRGLKLFAEPNVTEEVDSVISFLDIAKAASETPEDALQLSALADQTLGEPAVKDALQAAQRGLPGLDVEIICLGTGSAIPSMYRNASGTLLRVPGCGSYLFDCGENTLGQLRRLFPPDELREVLRDLKAVWISHLHADHHLGLISVIRAWHEEVWGEIGATTAQESESAGPLPMENRLFVISGLYFMKWLAEYSQAENFGYDKIIRLYAHKPLRSENCLRPVDFSITGDQPELFLKKAMSAMAVREIRPVNVDHSLDSHAVSFTFADGFKFSYSGDCRPSREFIRTGKDSTVLVHEATLENALWQFARAKKHCTVSEALSVAREMNAKRVILTHFSQRYPKLPLLDEIYGPDPSAVEAPVTTPAAPGPAAAPIDAPAPAPAPTIPPATTLAALQADPDNNTQIDGDGDVVAAPVSRRTSATRRPSSSPSPPSLDGERARSASPAAPDVKFAVAFDLMRIRVGEIIEFEHYVPALRKLFPSDDETDASAALIPELTDEGIGDVSTEVADNVLGRPTTEGSHQSLPATNDS